MTFASNNEHSEHDNNNNNRDHEDEMRMNTLMQIPQQAPPSPPPTDSSSHSADTDQIGPTHAELQQQLYNVHTNNHMNNDESDAVTQSTIDQQPSSTSIINEQQQHEQQYQQEPSTPPSEMEHNELVQSANKPPPHSPSHSPTRTTSSSSPSSSSSSSLSLSAITNEKDALNQSTLATLEQKSMTTTIDNSNKNNNTTDDEQNIVVSDHHCQSPAAAATTAVTPISNEQSIFLQNFNALGDLPLHLLNNIDFSFAIPFPNIDANSMANNSADVSSFVSLQLPPLDTMTFQLPPSLAAQHSGHSSPPKPQRMNAVATADDDGADDEMQGTSNEQQQNESQHASTFFPNDIKESMIEILHKLTMTQLVSLLETNKLFNKVTVRAKLSKKSARRSRRAKDSGTLEYAESAVIRKKYYIAIVDYIVSVGAKHFFAELDRSDMRATLKELIEKYDPSSGEELITSEEKKIVAQQVGDVDKLIKSQLRPYVKEYYKLLGFEGVMKELSHDTLKLYREVLEFPENEAENNEKETLMDAVLEEIFLHGAKHFLGKCKKDFLCQCAKRFGCSVKDGIQKDHVVALILSQEFSTLATDSLRSIYSTIPIAQPEPESESDQELQPDVPEKVHTPPQKTLRSESEDEQKTPSKIKVRVKHRDNDRPSIKKGVSLDDLLGFYLHEELRNFCRYNKMNYNGSKNDFAERILKYLEGNEPIWQPPPVKKKRAREEKLVDDEDELNFSSSSDEETTKPRKQHTPKKDSVVRTSKKPRLSSARGQQESLVLERRPVVLLTPKQPPKKSITMAPASTKKSVEPQEKSQTSHLTVSERMAPTSFAVTHDIPRESTTLQTSEPPRSPARDSYQQTENTLPEVTPENVVINKAEREIAANVTEKEIEKGIEMEIEMETEKVIENIAEIVTESVAENVVEQVTAEVTVPSTSEMEHEEMYHESEQTQIPMQPERPSESPSEEPINTSLKEIEMEFAMETEMEDEKSPEELIPIIYDSQPTTNEEETHLKKPHDIDLNSDDEEDLEFDVIMDIDSDDEQPASRTIEHTTIPQDTVEVNEYMSDEEDDGDIIINLDED